ncbi:hypothetical protein D3C84_1034190 [compost metagenome]
MITTSIPDSIDIFLNPASASAFETPYGSLAWMQSVFLNGVSISVDSPFTLILLMKIKRLTPEFTACRAKFNVPATLTLRYAINGSISTSSIT